MHRLGFDAHPSFSSTTQSSAPSARWKRGARRPANGAGPLGSSPPCPHDGCQGCTSGFCPHPLATRASALWAWLVPRDGWISILPYRLTMVSPAHATFHAPFPVLFPDRRNICLLHYLKPASDGLIDVSVVLTVAFFALVSPVFTRYPSSFFLRRKHARHQHHCRARVVLAHRQAL